MMRVVACREERWVMTRPSGRSWGDTVTAAGPGRARRSRTGLILFLAGMTVVVPWGLFILALIPDPTTGHRDTSFVVISLIYALIMTPVAVCILWAVKHDSGYCWAEDDGTGGAGT
jgi:hypothetical protein